MRRNVAVSAVLAGLACAAFVLLNVPSAAQGQETFKCRLSSIPVDAKSRPDIGGVGAVTAVLAGSKLNLNGTFEQFKYPATIAKLHQSKVTGMRGAAIFDLTVTKAMSGTVSGSFDLTPQQVDALKKGQLYVQIHTDKAPEGNVWGWLQK